MSVSHALNISTGEKQNQVLFHGQEVHVADPSKRALKQPVDLCVSFPALTASMRSQSRPNASVHAANK